MRLFPIRVLVLLAIALATGCAPDADAPTLQPRTPDEWAAILAVAGGERQAGDLPTASSAAAGQPFLLVGQRQASARPGSRHTLTLLTHNEPTATVLVQVAGASSRWDVPVTIADNRVDLAVDLPAGLPDAELVLRVAVRLAGGRISAPDTVRLQIRQTPLPSAVDPQLVGLWSWSTTEPGVNQNVLVDNLLAFTADGKLLEGTVYRGCTANNPPATCGLLCDNGRPIQPGDPLLGSVGTATGTGASFQHQLRWTYTSCGGRQLDQAPPETATYRVLANGTQLEWTWPGAQTVRLTRVF